MGHSFLFCPFPCSSGGTSAEAGVTFGHHPLAWGWCVTLAGLPLAQVEAVPPAAAKGDSRSPWSRRMRSAHPRALRVLPACTVPVCHLGPPSAQLIWLLIGQCIQSPFPRGLTTLWQCKVRSSFCLRRCTVPGFIFYWWVGNTLRGLKQCKHILFAFFVVNFNLWFSTWKLKPIQSRLRVSWWYHGSWFCLVH